MNNKSLREMSKDELRKYLSEYRNDEQKFSEGLEVLLERMPPQEQWNSPCSSLEEAEAIFREKLKDK